MITLRHGTKSAVVRLQPRGDGFDADIDGRRHEVAVLARQGTGHPAAEVLALLVDGTVHTATVARTREAVLVAIAGHVLRLETPLDDAREDARSGGSGLVTAPMPGKIVAVLVATGDAVIEGQPLIVLEAMKMETTLTAAVGGMVVRLETRPGAAVDAGALLVEIRAED